MGAAIVANERISKSRISVSSVSVNVAWAEYVPYWSSVIASNNTVALSPEPTSKS
ncbi:hypothetical protein ES708_21972 [subsurface metagenome]